MDRPDLEACLRAGADKAADDAAECFADDATIIGASPKTAGEAALRPAFGALARRDDRGNWARRFAEEKEIVGVLAADPVLVWTRLSSEVCWKALKRALHTFLMRGYLSGGDGRPYDISHEALIRNWPRFLEWLRDPADVARALSRVMTDVNP